MSSFLNYRFTARTSIHCALSRTHDRRIWKKKVRKKLIEVITHFLEDIHMALLRCTLKVHSKQFVITYFLFTILLCNSNPVCVILCKKLQPFKQCKWNFFITILACKNVVVVVQDLLNNILVVSGWILFPSSLVYLS